MKRLTISLALITAAVPAMADEIDRLGGYRVGKVLAHSWQTRIDVARAGQARFGLSENQMTSFLACLKGAARMMPEPTLKRAAKECGPIAKGN